MKSFKKLRISFFNSNQILKISSGEVKKSDTINYRTLKPEKNGLFCQKIFGPYKKNSCNCNKYKKKNILNNLCKKCGVNVNNLYLKRNNIGHIVLQCCVFHIFLFKTSPYYLSLILNLKRKIIEKIIYYEIYYVIESNVEYIKKNTFISSSYYFKVFNKVFNICNIKSGCDALFYLLKKVDYSNEYFSLKDKIKYFYKNENKRMIERFNIISFFFKNNIRMEDYIIKVLPVLPCGLRPLVKIDKNKIVSSDLNELYSIVLNRNDRLKKVNNIEAPEFILKTEKKLIQESVDCLFENGKNETFYKKNSKKPFKSISDNLKGKKGIFRNNLLGKRVDYSARSVIVVEPNIKLNYCCIPIKIAIELFRPFIYRKLLKNFYCNNIIEAKNIVDNQKKISIKILKKIIRNKYIILNRAPTLHRLGIQSFKILLVKDRAIHIHPLVCSSYNADFDGDQMGVHIPLSRESIYETKKLLKSTNNIINPSNGNITILPTQDIILGINYLTSNNYLIIENIEYFDNIKDVINYYFIKNEINYCIYFKISNGKFIKTSCRRILFLSILPKKNFIIKYNKVLYKHDIYEIIYYVYNKYDKKFFFEFIYKLIEFGFYYATKSGISISNCDLKFKSEKEFYYLIKDINNKLNILKKNFGNSKTYKKIEKKIFNKFYKKNNNEMLNFISKDFIDFRSKGFKVENNNSLNKIYKSGSKGSEQQINQISGIRGFMMKQNGKILKTPVLSNFYYGLNTDQYFLSSHGARKGLSDTSLKTANSGYLTRRLVDVSHNVVIKLKDCKTKKYSRIFFDKSNYFEYLGYCIFSDIYYKKKKILKKNSILNEEKFMLLIKNNINIINIRNPIFCKINNGLCSLCYGIDFSKNKIVDIGHAVGVIAAQSIGEPGTQLTMRTFHTGGVYFEKKEKKKFIFKKYCFINNYNNNLFNCYKKNSQINNKSNLSLTDLTGKLLYSNKVNPGINYNNSNKVNFSNLKFSKKTSSKKIILDIKNVKINFINFLNNYKYVIKKSYIYFYIEYKNILNIPYLVLEKSEKYLLFLYNKYIIKLNRIKNLFNITVYYYKKEKYHKDITDSLLDISNIFENRLTKKNDTIQYYDGLLNFNKNGLKFNNKFLNKSYKVITNKPLLFGIKKIINKGLIVKKNDYNLNDYLSLVGLNNFCNHFVNELKNIYLYHNISISRKHFEVILKKMLNNIKITKRKNKFFYKNQILKIEKLNNNNFYKRYLYGVTKSSLNSESFISAASFQDTIKILVNASIYKKIDNLKGLKENVIVGKFIPAGTGIFYKYFYE
ncbi:DNA-directed RNA polymerase subunit beta' [Candidatus Vidania fulgoroideorum]